jgi:carboxypeptidase PM20D1
MEIAIACAGVIAALMVICLIRVFTCRPKGTLPSDPRQYALDKDVVAKHLSDAIRVKTVSYMEDNKIDFDQFTEFHNFLKRTYPNIHSRMLREVVDGYSLLYRWPGIDINKRPRLLMAHMDVVPVEENTDHDWTHKRFRAILPGDTSGAAALLT